MNLQLFPSVKKVAEGFPSRRAAEQAILRDYGGDPDLHVEVNDLIAGACEAEDHFSPDELEEYTRQDRELEGEG